MAAEVEDAGSAVLVPAAASLNGTLTRRSLPVILTQEVTQVDLHTCSLGMGWDQSCRRLPNFGGSPEFGSFQKIAQNFCAIFKIGQKRSKKLPNATKTLEKLPK